MAHALSLHNGIMLTGGGECVHAPVGLTARRPDLMAHALSLHNGIMELAKDDNCGSIIRQEGGESVRPPGSWVEGQGGRGAPDALMWLHHQAGRR